MAIVITELLGTDSMAGSRFTINANFKALKDEVENIESVFGLSLTSGNLDVSGATGGSIKGKSGAFNTIVLPAAGTPTISLTGTSGAMIANTLTLNTSLSTPTVNISLGGTLNNQGSSTFDGPAVFNDIVYNLDGLIYGKIDIGATVTHTVLNSDRVVIFESNASPGTLSLTPDPALVDGHVITIVKRGVGVCTLDTSNILGYTGATIDFATDPYRSSITLQWDSANTSWIVLGTVSLTVS